jgi:3-hydroxyisobutyrate dehydrogenase-like beta-hydroxyacid dehydrogenase
MRVSVLGMGRMGRALAGRLLDTGHAVTVWNRTAARATPLLHRGASLAPSPADAAAAGDQAVLVSLADEEAVRQTVLGDSGVISSLPDTAVVVDMSTVGPAMSREEEAAIPGGRFLAAPIAGAPAAVESGQAVLIVGGGRSWVDVLEGLFDDLAGGYMYAGEDPGAALILKLLNNYLLMSGIAVLGEVVAAAEGTGLDPSVIHTYLSSSPLVAPALHNRLEDILHGDHEGWFSVTLGEKDVRLAIEVAVGAGIDFAIAESVASRYRAAGEAGLGEKDIAAVVELARHRPH